MPRRTTFANLVSPNESNETLTPHFLIMYVSQNGIIKKEQNQIEQVTNKFIKHITIRYVN